MDGWLQGLVTHCVLCVKKQSVVESKTRPEVGSDDQTSGWLCRAVYVSIGGSDVPMFRKSFCSKTVSRRQRMTRYDCRPPQQPNGTDGIRNRFQRRPPTSAPKAVTARAKVNVRYVDDQTKTCPLGVSARAPALNPRQTSHRQATNATLTWCLVCGNSSKDDPTVTSPLPFWLCAGCGHER